MYENECVSVALPNGGIKKGKTSSERKKPRNQLKNMGHDLVVPRESSAAIFAYVLC